MKYQSFVWSLTFDRHGKASYYDVLCYPFSHGPFYDLTIEKIEHDSKIHPALLCPNIRDVSRPRFVGGTHGKILTEKVLDYR